MGAKKGRFNPSGPRVVPIDGREPPKPPKTLASLTEDALAAREATDAALSEGAERLGWTSDQCLAAAAGRTGWPPYVEIDDLASIVRLQDCLADEHDAAATLAAFQDRSEAS